MNALRIIALIAAATVLIVGPQLVRLAFERHQNMASPMCEGAETGYCR